ncbi:hypothetical protein [Xanthobacter sediminis]|uniref:hypothetical protein n=1 Tax=Xanthobacter sediminis TaxID=3119926 RepID=UPI00372AB464
MAFFAQGNNTTLPHMLRLSTARGGQMEITPAGGSPYFVSPEINADGNMLEISDDDTSSVRQISLFLATGRGPLYVTSPNDMKWDFPADGYTARLFLETCGIISRDRDVGRTAERATGGPEISGTWSTSCRSLPALETLHFEADTVQIADRHCQFVGWKQTSIGWHSPVACSTEGHVNTGQMLLVKKGETQILVDFDGLNGTFTKCSAPPSRARP